VINFYPDSGAGNFFSDLLPVLSDKTLVVVGQFFFHLSSGQPLTEAVLWASSSSLRIGFNDIKCLRFWTVGAFCLSVFYAEFI
jgi:hypothetical protein